MIPDISSFVTRLTFVSWATRPVEPARWSRSRRCLIALKRCVSSSSVSIFSSSRAIFAFGASLPRSFSSAWPTESLVVSATAKSSPGEIKDRKVERTPLPSSARFSLVSVVLHASASIPSCTPASLTFCGSGHADTIDSCPARSASDGSLRYHALRLVDRRDWHCLCWRCDGYGEGSKSDQSDHPLPPMSSRRDFLKHG